MLSDNDGGIKRRVKIIKFPNLFVIDPVKYNERKMDENILEKLKLCNREFFEILIEYYKIYLKDGLIEPESVNDLSNDYIDDNKDDSIIEFIENNIICNETTIDNILTKNDVKRKYKDLYNKNLNIDDFNNEIKEKYDIEWKKSRSDNIQYKGFLGLSFKDPVF